MLTHAHLKNQGLKLTQMEAQELQPMVNAISQGHNRTGIVYPGENESDKPKSDPLREYYSELQVKNNALLKENGELREQLRHAITSIPIQDEKIKSGADNCQYTLGTIRKYKLRRVMTKGKELKEPVQSIYLIPETFKIARIIFYEFNPDHSFDARFGNYEKVDSTQFFPMKMNYIVKAQKNIRIDINYTKISLNIEQSFPFKIPDNYEQIKGEH